MEFEKLIGFKLDTNQFTSKTIENTQEAKMSIEKVIRLYGKEMLNHMFLCDNKRYSSFKKEGIPLSSILN